MTATDTAAAETAAGITDQQLTALQAGGWGDDGGAEPGWEREAEAKDGGGRVRQRVWPLPAWGRWYANSGDDRTGADVFDEALAWCDEQAGGRKSDKTGSATKQENRFASLTAAS